MLEDVPLAFFRDLSGWTALAAAVLIFARMLSKGTLITSGQWSAMKDVNDTATVWLKDSFDTRVQEQKDYYENRLEQEQALHLRVQQDQREIFDARLYERDELLEESRDNLREMLRLSAIYGDQITGLARSQQTTESVLLALDEALLKRPNHEA